MPAGFLAGIGVESFRSRRVRQRHGRIRIASDMNRMMRRLRSEVGFGQQLLLKLLFLVLMAPSVAEESPFRDPLDGAFDVSRYLSDNAFGALPLPIIISEPAVDQGLGIAGLFFHETREEAAFRRQKMRESPDAARFLLPPSVSVLAGAYTGNGSWLLGGGHAGFYNQGRQRYEGFAGYADITLDYYSVDDVSLDQPFSLRTQGLGIINSFKWKLGELPVFLGSYQSYIDTWVKPSGLANWFPPDTPDEVIGEITDLLTADTTLSGLGLDIELDTRDNLFTPIRGMNVELRAVFHRDSIGSDVDYDSFKFDALFYQPLTERWRMGLRFAGEWVESDDSLPPFVRPGLVLRGIPAARYQGERTANLEGELTWQVTPRWSVLGFAGGGRAWTQDESFSDVGTVTSAGGGFRYQIARSYGVHMGLDVARGPEDTVVYIQFGSAW